MIGGARPFALLPIALLLFLFLAMASHGQAPKPPLPEPPAIERQPLRRIYVPADSLESEARGLWPIARAEFERRIKRFERAQVPAETPPAAVISQSIYRATLRGEQLAQGTAELTIERQKLPRAAADETTWLLLSPCSLALGSPTWQGLGNNETAEAATWGNNDKQQLLLAVTRDGVLQFPWSARGRRDERGRLKFVFELPPAARQRFELKAPTGLQLTSDRAVVREAGAAAADDGSQANDATADSLWEIEVAGGERVEIVVQPRQADKQLAAQVLVRETGSYVFTPGQMDLDLSLELDIDRAPLKQIRIRHDPRLHWTAVRWGEQTLPWTTETSASGDPVAVIVFPEALTGSSRLIQLTAVADWSPSPQKWQLPRASVEEAIWQEGRINVAAPRWLQLDATAGQGARLSATTLASDSQTLDHLQFQLESNTARIEVQAATPVPQLEATSLLTLQVEPKQMIANLAAELSIASGTLFTVECEVPRTWVLDSLETVPADLLEDRTTRGRGNLQTVTLQLKQPLRPGRPLRLNARLRHVRGTGAEVWGDEILQPVRFTAAAEPQRYVTLQFADASFEPKLLSAAGLEFLAPADLPAKVKALSEAPLGSWLVRLIDAARQPRFLLAPGSPRYAADSTLQIQLAEQRADYSLQIRCEPESSAVSNVLVQLRPAPETDPQWRLAGDERPLVAERVEMMLTSGDQPGPALYRVELPRPRDMVFVLNAQWTAPLIAATFVPLAELPEASAHAAQVEIAGPLDTPFTWQAEFMRPLPVPADALQVRSRYHYQAGQEARLRIAPLVDSHRSAAGWISRCDVESEFSPTGAARHEARYVVVGDDVETLELRLSESARLARAVVDGREVLAFSRTSDPRWLSIPLRNGEAGTVMTNPRVRIEYTSPATFTNGWLTSRWTAPIPETRLPMLQSFWQARLPSNWKLWPGDEAESSLQSNADEDSLGMVLFHSLWQPSGKLPIMRDLPTGDRVQIAVYSPAWLGLIALVVVFLAAALALRLKAWSPFHVVAAAAVMLAIALLATEPTRGLIQAALAGWLIGFALHLFRRPVKVETQPVSAASTSFSLQPLTRLFVLLAGLWALTSLHDVAYLATSPVQAAEEGAASKPWRVVIPVDEERQPTNYVYVSEPLYIALFRGDTKVAADQPAWLLRSAQYNLRWDSGSADMAAGLNGFVARFEVDVLQERTVIGLPFIREQLRLIDPGVKIDGEAAAATWSLEGDALQIEATGVGRKSIEIGFALAMPPKDGALGAQIRIPVAANSRVQVPPLPAGEVVTIPVARGAEQAAADGSWQVELGAAELLAAQWSRAAAEPAPVIEAEQLLLWRLRPSSVVVDGKWEFRPLSGKLRELVLRADPRFRLLPTGNGTNIVRQWTEEGESNLHHFVLERPATGEATLNASFLLVGSTGIGNLVPPRLEPATDRVARDWQAAWIAPGLQWNGKPGTLPTAEFLQAWGDQSLSSVQAFRSSVESPRPTLAVAAVQTRLQAEQHIEWSLAPDQISVRYRLQGNQFSADVNQLRLQLSPQFAVRRVTVMQNDATVVSRWLRHPDGLLTVLLDEVRAEPWVVEVDADRPHVAGKQASLPILQAADIDVQPYQGTLRRRAGTTVALGKIGSWKNITAEAAADADADAATERLVAQLEWTSTKPGATPPAIPVTIAASSPDIAGELLTRLLPDEEGWQVEVVASLRSKTGQFDELQFSVPRDWEGPFEIEPAARYAVELLPGQSRNLLRVQLLEPANARLQLRLTGPLVTEQELIRLPTIDLVGGQEELHRWIALPRRGSDSPLQWQTAGLQLRGELPASFANADSAAELFYEAIIDRYRASARPERTRREQPRIILADNHVAWQADRRVVGLAELTVLPNGARTLHIQPPPAHELVGVVVNNVPGQLRWEPGISGAATIELHSDAWPQWVQVIYRGRLAASAAPTGRWEFSAPRISNAPVEHTRWQIVGPTALLLPETVQQSNAASVDDALAPFEALVQVARGDTDAPAGNHAESAGAWLTVWRQHWDRETATIRKRSPSSPLAPVIAARLQALKNEMADQLPSPGAETVSDAAPALDKAFSLAPTSEVAIAQPLHELRHSMAGDLSTLTVIRPLERRAADTALQSLIAAALLTFAAALTQLSHSPSFRDWIVAHPQLMLALCGVAALLIPGYLWLGGLLLASSVLATLHSPWQQRGG